MARVVKPTVTRLQKQKAAATKKKIDAAIRKGSGQALPLSKEKKRYAPPKKASDQSKASMKRHVIGSIRAEILKAFPELKTTGSSKAKSLLKAPGHIAAKRSKARYSRRKKKTVS